MPGDRHVPDERRDGRRRQGALHPGADQRQTNIRELTDLPNLTLLEIEHFFTVYKDLEPGKSVEGAVWVGHAEAEREIRESWSRARGTSYENGFTRSDEGS